MIYYVKTGDVDTCLSATSHFHAAQKAVGNGADCGICVIVSNKEINETNAESNVYFLTTNVTNRPSMRLVY